MIHDEGFDDEHLRQVAYKLYEHLFGEKFPYNWKILFGVQGITIPEEKVVLLATDSLSGDAPILDMVHEFIHVQHPEWSHDDETFGKAEGEVMEKAMEWLEGHCEGCGRLRE